MTTKKSYAGRLSGCPFCGSKPDVETIGTKTRVSCVSDSCGALLVTVQHADAQVAVKTWNTRAGVAT